MNESTQGWKTYLAAGASIMWGTKLILVDGMVNEGAGFILAGLALIGVRGAFAKLIKSNQQ